MISSLSKIAELSKAQTYIHPTSLWMAAIPLKVVDGQNTGCPRMLHWRFISRGHRTCIILKCFLCRQQQIRLCFTIKHNVSSPYRPPVVSAGSTASWRWASHVLFTAETRPYLTKSHLLTHPWIIAHVYTELMPVLQWSLWEDGREETCLRKLLSAINRQINEIACTIFLTFNTSQEKIHL